MTPKEDLPLIDRLVIAELTKPGDVVMADIARKVWEEANANHKTEFGKWVREQAMALIQERARSISARYRQQVTKSTFTAAFREAVENDTVAEFVQERGSIFNARLALLADDGTYIHRRIREMTGVEIMAASRTMHSQGSRLIKLSAVWEAVGRKCGKRYPQEVYSEEQLRNMFGDHYQSIVDEAA